MPKQISPSEILKAKIIRAGLRSPIREVSSLNDSQRDLENLSSNEALNVYLNYRN